MIFPVGSAKRYGVKNVEVCVNQKNDRKAYERLQSAELSLSKAVISAICRYIELTEIKANEAVFL